MSRTGFFLGIALLLGVLAVSARADETLFFLPGQNTAESARGVSIVDELQKQASRHLQKRDLAYANLQKATSRLTRKYWVTTIIREEATRVLMLVRAIKVLKHINSEYVRRLVDRRTLAGDPDVRQTVEGMHQMLVLIRELSADSAGRESDDIGQIERNLAVLCRLYSEDNIGKKPILRSKRLDDQLHHLKIQYTKLHEQFNRMIEEESI